jgi:flavin-dependent dehydrogenase
MGADGFVRNGRFYAGEAAGLQDAAFGFGIRSAVISGSMATESLIDGKDYKKEARGRYRRYMEATFTLRLLWEHGLARIYPDLYNAAGKINKEMPLWLSGLFYRDTLINRGLFPLAQRILGDRREEGRSATGVEGSKAFME